MGLTQVSTDGVKNDAITKTKIPANQIEASELADNAVDTNAIADQAVALSKLPHGDGSSDGKFLRANNGADPSFETVSIPAGTTINNNADNRVITGSGTANTLNGESVLTFDSSTDTLQVHQQNTGNNPAFKSIHRGGSGTNINAHFTNYSGTADTVILHDGSVGIGTTDPSGESINGSQNLVIMDTSSDGGINIKTGTSANAQIHFSDTSANGRGRLIYNHADDSMQYYTAGSERMRIDSSGRAGIGVTSFSDTSSALTIKNMASGSEHTQLEIICDDNETSRVTFSEASNLNNGSIRYNFTSDARAMTFHTNGNAERMRILSSGGITFNGDTSSNNALSDYEEGTFTPSWQMTQNNPSITYYNQEGSYVKIGSLVQFQVYIRVNQVNANGSGICYMSGLPFNASTGTHGYGVPAFGYGDGIQNMNSRSNPVAYIEKGAARLYMYVGLDGNGNQQNMTVANNITNNTQMRFCGTYRAS